MKIYIMRHGETDWNVEKRLQGRTDIPLNNSGKRLAKVTAEALRIVPFDLAYTSPLSRAKETAEIILNGRDIQVIDDERLIEISFGIFEGMISGRENYEIPDSDFKNFFNAPECYAAPEGGEDFHSLLKRTKAFMDELVNRPELQNKTILITSHGAAVRGLLNSVKKSELADFWDKKVPGNCSVAILESHDGNTVILEENKVYYE